MKKTIITVALALISCVTFAHNAYEVNPENVSTEVNWEKNADLSSFCKAIMKGNLEMVKQLIEIGEDVNAKSLGKTPAMYAARYNKVDVLKLLVAKGADLSIKSDGDKFTAKKFAELSNAKEALAYLNSLEK
ncbi:ankyrin repeat domain-containing protein [Mesonia sp.]|uniref:ankyrin repeat domain-containing protein n=1 Tax=Mesonia sp. TaxID=1960830 RepID=UPI00175EFED2|nr:ankyrin repeat domain-containing protein [Mesonia sp.]HIB36160.1 ankyrin repeat domain-containing protein [Mesonia sp.]HIO28011.1 ankyrin repeat domain-containing protein [Flavobacteriaceae bacterium]